MCGRFTLTTKLDVTSLASLFGAQAIVATIQPRYNIAPTQRSVVVLTDRDQRVLDSFKWGIVPAWANKRGTASGMINARAESISKTPMFRDSFIYRRCLIPTDGFYEWAGHERRPHWIRLRDSKPAAYAGLYERRIEEDGTELSCFTIITTDANQLLCSLHDRMPVILTENSFDQWLDPLRPTVELQKLLRPYPAEEMCVQPVTSTVNHPDTDSSDCILPAVTTSLNREKNLSLFN